MKKNIFVFLLVLISVGIFAFPKYDINNCEKREFGKVNNVVQGKTLSNNGRNFGYNYLKVDGKNLFTEKTKAVLPSKYSLKDYDYISPVRDQGSWGTCWAHGALASLESSALRNYGYDSISFSPLNMANKTLWPFSTLNDGGNIYKSMGYLSHLLGPVLESDDPYEDPYESPEATTPYGACNKVEMLDDDEFGLTSDEISEIKNHIYENNAVAVSIYYNDGLYQTSSGGIGYNDDNNYFNTYIVDNYIYWTKMLSYYCDDEVNTGNHIVTIVGWDDNYSKSNFKTTPAGNGAFLIKNSYGTDIHDYGYFWLSYYDKNIIEAVSYEFVSPEDKKYDKIYTPNDSTPLANISFNTFCINYDFEENGSITGVQVYSFIGGVTYNVQIVDSDDNIVASKSQKIPYFGYNTIMLDTPVEYEKGDTYYCYICTNATEIADADHIPLEVSYEFDEGTYTVTNHSDHYGIYDSSDSSWFSYQNANPAAGILVKTESENVPVTGVEMNKDTYTLNVGDSIDISTMYTVKPSNATNKEVYYLVAKNQSIYEVSGTKLVAKEAGTTSFGVHTKDGGYEDTCTITVVNTPAEIYYLSWSDGKLHTGDLSMINYETTDLYLKVNGSFVYDDITWTSSDTSVVEVSQSYGYVVAEGAGTATITAKTSDGTKATINVTVTEETISDISIYRYNPDDYTYYSKDFISLKNTEHYLYLFTSDNKQIAAEYATWTSSDTKIVKIGGKWISVGVTTQNTNGTATITANLNGVKDVIKVTVCTPIDSLELSDEWVDTYPGKTYNLKATVKPSDAEQGVTWESDDEDVAIVDENGVVTAISEGLAIITCTTDGLDEDGNPLTATCFINVKPPIPPEKIILNKTSLTIYAKSSYNLTATVYPTNTTDKTVNWKSSNNSIATVDENGKVTGVAAGVATITATTNAKSAKGLPLTASCSVTVKNPILVEKITLNKSSITLKPGKTFKLIATITPSNATNKKVTWKSSDPSIATVGETGIVYAQNKNGIAKITCTATDGSNKKAECYINVYGPILVEKITLNKSSITFSQPGKKFKLIATITPTNASKKKVTWTSSNPSVATVGSTGIVTGIKGGNVTITATAQDGTGVYAECKVVVNPVPVEDLEFNKHTLKLKVGKTFKIIATITPSNAKNKKVTWTSSNTSVATVGTTGIVTAKKAGTCKIVAKAQDTTYKASDICDITVIEP